MSKARRQKHKIQANQQRLQKWCKRICQKIRSYSYRQFCGRLQIHFLKNPRKNEPGICAEYTTQKLFEISIEGNIKEIGKIFVLEGTTEEIADDILKNDYDLL